MLENFIAISFSYHFCSLRFLIWIFLLSASSQFSCSRFHRFFLNYPLKDGDNTPEYFLSELILPYHFPSDKVLRPVNS